MLDKILTIRTIDRLDLMIFDTKIEAEDLDLQREETLPCLELSFPVQSFNHTI